jgi:uncharacterized membrane protein
MRQAAYVFSWLELVGLGLWIGGMVTLGALVAPAVFDMVKPVEMAGDAMSMVFRKFNGGLVYLCILLVVVGFTGKLFLASRGERSRWVEAGMLIGMILIGLYIGVVLGPRMQELRQIRISDPSNTGAVVQFDRDHRFSERLFTLNLILGLGALFMNAREMVSSEGKEDGSNRPS